MYGRSYDKRSPSSVLDVEPLSAAGLQREVSRPQTELLAAGPLRRHVDGRRS